MRHTAAPTIRRVGHIRVFAGLASLATAAVLVHVVRADLIGLLHALVLDRCHGTVARRLW